MCGKVVEDRHNLARIHEECREEDLAQKKKGEASNRSASI